MLALGDVMTAVLYQTGEFGPNASRYVWGFWRAQRSVCWRRRWAGLYASTYYALHDTRTPLRFAIRYVSRRDRLSAI